MLERIAARGFWHRVRADFAANADNPKGKLILLAFRVASLLRGDPTSPPPLFAKPIGFLYRICVEWLLGVELPWKTTVGPGFRIDHGFGLVINDGAVIGSNVTVRHGVTIGVSREGGKSPRIGDRVNIGAGAIIIGDVEIGHDSRVGAGSVVTRSFPPHSRIVGNPARALPDSNPAS